MKCNQWTLGLAAVGLVSLASVVRADEKPSSVMTALSSTTLSGYVDTSAQWNLGTGDAHVPGYGFSAGKSDGFNLNVVDLNLEKDADATDGWGSGYRVELWMGPDADGLATSSSGVSGDLAVKNAYVDLKAPVGTGLDIKIGVWDTLIGYEVADSPNNPNFTRSYGFSIEPTTHTGVQFGYTINDMFSVSAAIADTDGPAINARSLSPNGSVNESYKTYMASMTFTAPTNWGWVAGSTLSGGVINGFAAGAGPGPLGRNQDNLYVGSSINTPLKALKAGWSYDYVGANKQALTGQHSVYQNAFGIYTTYQLTEKMSVNGRAEYFSQSQDISAYGLPSKVIEVTATLQYDLWKNVLSRVEARWDHQAGSLATGLPGEAYGGTTAASAGTLHNSYELLANIVYKF
jgi:predicted porin